MAIKKQVKKRVPNYPDLFGGELSEIDATLIVYPFAEQLEKIDTTLIRDHFADELSEKLDTRLIEPLETGIEPRRSQNFHQVGKYTGANIKSRERRNKQLWESLYPTQNKTK